MKINVHNSLIRAARHKVGEGSAAMSIETIDQVSQYISYLLRLVQRAIRNVDNTICALRKGDKVNGVCL